MNTILCLSATFSLDKENWLIVWLHFLTFANSAAITMEVQMSLGHNDFILFGYIPRNGLLGHRVFLFLIFEENL